MGVVDHIKLYLITDDGRSRGRDVEEVVEAAVAGGVKMVQYRPLGLSDVDFALKAARLRRITRKAGVFFLINGRPDIALQVGADGVHIGKKSMDIPAARRRLIDSGIVGFSAHSLEEAMKAQEDGADFVTFSPVFPTYSSSDPRPVVGVDALKDLSGKLSIPVFPLGGIGLENIEQIGAAGLRRAAVVSAITEAADIKKAAEDLLAAIVA